MGEVIILPQVRFETAAPAPKPSADIVNFPGIVNGPAKLLMEFDPADFVLINRFAQLDVTTAQGFIYDAVMDRLKLYKGVYGDGGDDG